MTDKPTDEALENLFVEETGFDPDDFPAAIFGFARAVLAKWGQPAQAVVGGKPVYQASYKGGFWQDSSRERHEYLKTPEGSLATDWELRVLYTTPQPVAREPLSHAQAKALVLKYGNDPLNLVFQVELAHGIKGGQHGTESST